jgi:hypothetical protein
LALLVALLYAGGNLGALLASFNTLIGLVLFIGLWLTTWWCTRRGLRAVRAQTLESPLTRTGEMVRALLLGGVWGGINGVLFLGIVLGGIVVSSLVQTISTANSSSLLIPVFGLFGLPLAFIVGAVVGVTLAAIDGALLELARVLVLKFAATERET